MSKEVSSLDEINNGDVYEDIKFVGLQAVLSVPQLKQLAQNIKEEGKLRVETAGLDSTNLTKLKMNLRLAGYIAKEEDGWLDCTRKVWTKGANSDNPWKMIKLEEKSELILEKELIDPNDKFQKFSTEDDCMTKPKPCKNCNCGRAELENKKLNINGADVMVPNMKSDCGKCYLGDAYRCAGCPYRGMPAFEPGDKIEVKNVQVQEKVDVEKSGVKVKGNTIKLDI
jgi:hypothetical protein